MIKGFTYGYHCFLGAVAMTIVVAGLFTNDISQTHSDKTKPLYMQTAEGELRSKRYED